MKLDLLLYAMSFLTKVFSSYQRRIEVLIWFTVIVAVLLPLNRICAGDFPLQNFAVIEHVNLSGEWRFMRDGADRGIDESWYEAGAKRDDWRAVAVPGIWDNAPGSVGMPVYDGIGWFAVTATVPEDWDENTALVMLGAMHVTDVWIDGNWQGVHRGGYTPFIFDITDNVIPGKTVELTFRIDNTLDNTTVPSRGLGWQNYGGLYREVYLVHLPRVRIAFPAVETVVTPEQNVRLHFTGTLRNLSGEDFSGEVHAELRADDRVITETALETAVAARAAGRIAFEMEVETPRLWSPDDPYLHELVISWRSVGSGHQPAPAKRNMTLRIGLRQIKISGGRFILNNEPLWLQGFGQHEDAPDYGPCLPPEMLRRDLEQMRQFGANAVRAGHYPFHPRFYNYCDELGLLVFTEIPVWQVGARVVNSADAWRQWLEPQLSAMIHTYRNHACIFAWGISNETRGGVDEYFRRATEHVRGIDATRPVTAVIDSTRDLSSDALFDFSARNLHYGWYHSREVYELRTQLERVLEAAEGRPLWVAETGGHARRGNLSGGYGDHSRGSETYLDRLLRFSFQYNAVHSVQVAGVSVWTWSDFSRRNRTEAHGILDGRRDPKLPAYSVRNLFEGDLRAFIIEEQNLCAGGDVWKAGLHLFNPYENSGALLHARWIIRHGEAVLAEERISFSATGVRGEPIGDVEWKVPENAEEGLYEFWIELTDADGNRLHTNSAYFDVGQPSRPGMLAARMTDDRVFAGSVWLEQSGIRIPVYRFPGLLLPLPEGRRQMIFRNSRGQTFETSVEINAGRVTTLDLAFE